MQVGFHRLAAQELVSARRAYARHSIRAAERFESEVEVAVQRITSAPLLGSPYDVHHRWVRLRRFPYLVCYRILDADHILIVAVAHARRRPGYWRRRRPGS